MRLPRRDSAPPNPSRGGCRQGGKANGQGAAARMHIPILAGQPARSSPIPVAGARGGSCGTAGAASRARDGRSFACRPIVSCRARVGWHGASRRVEAIYRWSTNPVQHEKKSGPRKAASAAGSVSRRSRAACTDARVPGRHAIAQAPITELRRLVHRSTWRADPGEQAGTIELRTCNAGRGSTDTWQACAAHILRA